MTRCMNFRKIYCGPS